jgi:hypothetical protein
VAGPGWLALVILHVRDQRPSPSGVGDAGLVGRLPCRGVRIGWEGEEGYVEVVKGWEVGRWGS